MPRKIRRKARKELVKKVDVMVPIDFKLEDIGSENDPCFSLHFDPRAPECQRCGDSEICAIAMGQKNHLLRNKVEATQRFKDIEEKDIKNPEDKLQIKRALRKRIREMVKLNPKGIYIEEVVNDIFDSFHKDGYSKKRINKIIDIMVEASDKIKKEKNKLIWIH